MPVDGCALASVVPFLPFAAWVLMRPLLAPAQILHDLAARRPARCKSRDHDPNDVIPPMMPGATSLTIGPHPDRSWKRTHTRVDAKLRSKCYRSVIQSLRAGASINYWR